MSEEWITWIILLVLCVLMCSWKFKQNQEYEKELIDSMTELYKKSKITAWLYVITFYIILVWLWWGFISEIIEHFSN